MSTKNASRVAAPAAEMQTTHLVKSHAPPKATPSAVAGIYRMIHGSIEIDLPRSEWTLADGSVNPDAPKKVRAAVHVIKRDEHGEPTAWKGDEVFLSNADAERLIAADMVEPLDAKPSRCGKVWDPPKPGKVWSPPQSKAERDAAHA